MRQHIDLYVNNYSLSLGEEGRSAIRKLFDVFKSIHGGQPDQSDGSLFL
jgi:1,4-dihydroxy-6-naphthoate synthase